MSSEPTQSPTQVASVPQEVTGQPRRVVVGGVTWRDTFAALKHRNFRLFFIGQLVSLTGSWVQNTAQGWLVYQMTGSKVLLGTVAADLAGDAGRAALTAAARRIEANVLINAAGINPFGLFTEQSAREIGLAFSINALAPVLLCHALLPVLLERPRAHIVNVGSTFGSIGFPGFAAYSATSSCGKRS